MRKMQTFQYFYMERAKEKANAGFVEGARLGITEEDLLMGRAGDEVSIMLCPALKKQFTADLEKEVVIMKQQRKNREERIAAAKSKG